MWFVAVVLATALLVGCSQEDETGGESMTVTDDRDREVTLPRPVTGVVSLGPSFTEIIFALEAEEKLIGVTTYCDYPEAASQKPKVGDFLNPSIERIIALEPDCILATGPTQARTIDRLEKLGLTVVQLNPESITGVLRCIRVIGHIVGRDSAAAALTGELWGSVTGLYRLTSQIENRKRVFVEIDTNPLVSAGPGSFPGELITLAGGDNIIESGSAYPVVNPEEVIRGDPEVMIIASPAVSLKEARERLGWQQVSAVRSESIRRVDPSRISRPGPRAVRGAAELYELIYPERAAQRDND